MKIYRVVGKDGNGFYNSITDDGQALWSVVSEKLGRNIGEMNTQHPAPYNDGIFEHTDDHYFGFANLNQLHKWFDKKFFNMSCKYGVIVEVWDVEPVDVLRGKTQVCFIKKEAKKLKSIKMDTLKRR